MDDNRTKAAPPANIGISLLLVVFLILCLFTFSAIALVQAKNELHQANLTRESRDNYYAAANKAENDLYDLNKALKAGTSDKTKNIEKEYKISDSQSLFVTITYFDGVGEGYYGFSRFATAYTKEWKGDDTVNVIR